MAVGIVIGLAVGVAVGSFLSTRRENSNLETYRDDDGVTFTMTGALVVAGN